MCIANVGIDNSLLRPPLVTVYVGQDPLTPGPLHAAEGSQGVADEEEEDEVEVEVSEYTLHKDLLCSSSEFFRAAFRGQMKESLSGKMHLPEETSENFDIFAEWVYSRRLPTRISAQRLLDIYFFADRYRVPTLHRQCFTRFIERYGKRVVPSDAILKALVTRPNDRSICPLRSYYVDLYSYLILSRRKRARWIWTLELDKMFAAEVALEVARLQLRPNPDNLEHPLDRNRRERNHEVGSRKRAVEDSNDGDDEEDDMRGMNNRKKRTRRSTAW